MFSTVITKTRCSLSPAVVFHQQEKLLSSKNNEEEGNMEEERDEEETRRRGNEERGGNKERRKRGERKWRERGKRGMLHLRQTEQWEYSCFLWVSVLLRNDGLFCQKLLINTCCIDDKSISWIDISYWTQTGHQNNYSITSLTLKFMTHRNRPVTAEESVRTISLSSWLIKCYWHIPHDRSSFCTSAPWWPWDVNA